MAAEKKAESDMVKQEIGKCYSQLMTGYQKGDWKVTSEIYGPNCIIMAPGKGAIKGREAAGKYWQQLKDETGVTKMEIKCDEINGQGDWYFERGAYRLFKGDKAFEERKYLKTWRKWEGKWHIYAYIFNSIPV